MQRCEKVSACHPDIVLWEAYLDGVAKLLTVAALDLGVIPRLGAFLGEMAHLITVTASNSGRVPRLSTIFADVVLGATVAAGSLGDVGALTELDKSC